MLFDNMLTSPTRRSHVLEQAHNTPSENHQKDAILEQHLSKQKTIIQPSKMNRAGQLKGGKTTELSSPGKATNQESADWVTTKLCLTKAEQQAMRRSKSWHFFPKSKQLFHPTLERDFEKAKIILQNQGRRGSLRSAFENDIQGRQARALQRPRDPPGVPDRHAYIVALRIDLLRLQCDKNREREPADEDGVDQFDMIYDIRMANSNLRYHNYKINNEKKIMYETQKIREQVEITKNFVQEKQKEYQMKTRTTDINFLQSKRKYFRQPKIYQNGFIDNLRKEDMVMDEYLEEDPFNPIF